MAVKIRVLHIVTRLAVRGVPRHVLDMANGLDTQRFAVEVLAGRSEPGEGDLSEEAREKGLILHQVPSLQRAVNPLADFNAYRAIARIVANGAYDIVHTHISKAGILGRMAAKQARVPIVLHTYHGLVDEIGRASFKAEVFRRCERWAALSTDALVAVSRSVARQWQDMEVGEEGQYRVVRNGIDIEHFTAAEAMPLAGEPRLVVVASHTAEKGLDVLLRAMSFIGGEFPSMCLYVVGDGPLRSQLQALSDELGLGAKVHFVGVQDDVRPYLAGCDLALLPSLSEGMGLAAVEAMAVGRAVVGSHTGGIPEVVIGGKTGLLVPPGDAQALAGAMATLLRNPVRRREMGHAGQERAIREFSLQGALVELQELYEELLQAKKVSS
jgi:glycosyltransferase involved in cell wall biosynthesis